MQAFGEVVVAHLVERSLLTPEVRGSNPIIGKIYIEHLMLTVLKKTKINKKRPRTAHIKKNISHILRL